jgi:hypothetical protein
MADNYTLTKLLDEPLVLSQTEVEDGTTVGFVTQPSQVYCEATLPKSQVQKIGVATVAEPLAFNIERLLADGHAVAAYFTQSTDASGLLASGMTFVVGVAAPGTFTGGTLTENVFLTIEQLYVLAENIHLLEDAKARLEALV